MNEPTTDRDVTVGSIWRHHTGRRYRVYSLSTLVPHGDALVSYQSLDDGRQYTQAVERFLGECDKCPGALRFVKEGE